LLRPAPDQEAQLEACLADLPPCWIAIDVTRITQTNPGPAALRSLLGREAELVRVVEGEDERFASGTALDDEGTRGMFGRLLHATAFGPRIQVYRWDRQVR